MPRSADLKASLLHDFLSAPRGKGRGDPLFAIPEQRREPLLAIAAEIDDAAAGGGIARGPFQLGESRHDSSTQRAGEMMAPFAPVETGLAHRAARMDEIVC